MLIIVLYRDLWLDTALGTKSKQNCSYSYFLLFIYFINLHYYKMTDSECHVSGINNVKNKSTSFVILSW